MPCHFNAGRPPTDPRLAGVDPAALAMVVHEYEPGPVHQIVGYADSIRGAVEDVVTEQGN